MRGKSGKGCWPRGLVRAMDPYVRGAPSSLELRRFASETLVCKHDPKGSEDSNAYEYFYLLPTFRIAAKGASTETVATHARKALYNRLAV